MDNRLVSFLGQLWKLETLADGSVKIQFITQEVSGEEVADILHYRKKMVYVIVGEDMINEIPRQLGDKLKKDMAATGHGTPSVQMRKALYIAYKANDNLTKSMKFEEYYTMKMQEFVEHIYSKVDAQNEKKQDTKEA